MIKLTEPAAREVARMLADHPESVGVRLFVRGHG